MEPNTFKDTLCLDNISREGQIALDNSILIIRSGSFLYGLNTPTSDEDYVGIFIPPMEYLFGTKTCEQVDLSVKSKLANGKNSMEAKDITFYSIQKFVKLALDNNPNILETLFVNEENIMYINELGERLLQYNKDFVSKRAEMTFFGYVKSQEKKIRAKKETFDMLKNSIEYLNTFDKTPLIELSLTNEDFDKYFKTTQHYFKVADYNIEKTITCKRAVQVLQDILGNGTNRRELIEINGYDTKFASHILRLLVQLESLCDEGKMTFPIQNREDILKTKLGEYSLDEVEAKIDEYKEKVRSKVHKLQDKEPKFVRIENILVEIVYEHFVSKLN